jgi:uncharacterized protein (DUF2141 family)
MAVTSLDLHRLYLAYFGRPADVAGMNYYLDPGTDWRIFGGEPDVTAGFSASPESTALYGPQFGKAQIQAIYRNLFNREAEADGVSYWLGEVSAGRLNPAGVAYAILLGAQNEDLACVNNKLRLCENFFGALFTEELKAGYVGDEAARVARSLVRTVGSHEDSFLAAFQELEHFTHMASGLVPMNLTPEVDRLVGGVETDEYYAQIDRWVSTLNEGDVIDGGEGWDALGLTLRHLPDGLPGFMVRGVETIVVFNVSGALQTINADQFEGAVEFAFTNHPMLDSSGLHFVNLKDSQQLFYGSDDIGQALDDPLIGEFAQGARHAGLVLARYGIPLVRIGGPTLEEVDVRFASNLSGLCRVERFLLTGAASQNLQLQFEGFDLELAEVDAQGGGATLTLAGAQLDEHNGSFRLDRAGAGVARIDASGFSGATHIHTAANAFFNPDLQYLGGTGNDTYHLRGSPAASLSGGDGDDTLVVHGAFVTDAAQIAGFETLRFELVGTASTSLGDLALGSAQRLVVSASSGFTIDSLAGMPRLHAFSASGSGPVRVTVGEAAFSREVEFDFSGLSGLLVFDASQAQRHDPAGGLRIRDGQATDTVIGSAASDAFAYTGGSDRIQLREGGDVFDFNGVTGTNRVGPDGVRFVISAADSHAGEAPGPDSVDRIIGVDSRALGATTGSTFVIEALPTASLERGTAVVFDDTPVVAGGYFILDTTAEEPNTYAVFQDSNGDTNIDTDDLMVRIVANRTLDLATEFRLTDDGHLAFRSA